MGKIERIERATGARSDMGDYEGEILGQPFICVCGKNEPRSNGKQVIYLPMCGDLKMYIRYESAREFNEYISKVEGHDVVISGSIVLSRELLEYYHLDIHEELNKAVEFMDSTEVSVKSMLEFAVEGGMFPAYLASRIPQDDPQRKMLVVATARNEGYYGAGVLGSKNIMERVRKQIGDFYIIPCSIHEIITLPKDLGNQIHDLVGMVKEVNETVVEPNEVLSDEIYYFDENGLQVANF